MRHISNLSLLSAFLFIAIGALPARSQSLLQNPSVFADVHGLNTVPDHGDAAVSFLDYRNFGYSIMAVDVASGTEEQLERVYYAEPTVSTFGPRVAWIGYTAAGQPDVYVHDRQAGSTERVTSDTAFQNHPDLATDILVWQDYRNAGAEGKNADVYMHDFATNTTSAVSTNPGYQDLPRVHGNWVVWQDYRHSSSLLDTADIYAYNIETKHEWRLTGGSAYRTHPAIWGDLVVWEDYRNGDNGDIYLFDLATSQETPITADAAHQSHPSLYGDWVLWLDYRNDTTQADIYGYNLKMQQEHALLIHPAHQEAPHVYGDHVVWQDYRDGRFDLLAGTLSDPTGTMIEDIVNRPFFELSASPNPSTHSVTFTLNDAPDGPLRLTIYDALGRTISRRQLSAGDSTVLWDGVSDTGQSVSSGLYIAVVVGRDVVEQIAFVRHR